MVATRAIPPTLPWLRGPISYTSLSCNRQIVSTGTWENAEKFIKKRRETANTRCLIIRLFIVLKDNINLQKQTTAGSILS